MKKRNTFIQPAMKIIMGLVLIFFIAPQFNCFAQVANDFFLNTGSQRTLNPGGKLDIYVEFIDTSEVPHEASPTEIDGWAVNGKSSLDATDGKLDPDLTLTHATYTAPEIAPANNPVAITVKVKPYGSKSVVILYCNVTVRKAAYRITMDAEQTVSDAGQDIKLHGECFANLKALPDGNYFLEPVDKTRNMQVTVEKGILAEKDGGSGKLIAPFSYSFPFLFGIDKMNQSNPTGHGTVYLYYTSPQKGKVIWKMQNGDGVLTETVDIDQGSMTYAPGTTTQVGKPGNDVMNAIALSATTNLNLLNYLVAADQGKLAIQNANQNISNAQDKMDFAKQLQAHLNDPNYFKTQQGQADLQKAMSMQEQMGGNIGNISDQTKQIDAEITNKTMNDQGYAGSKQFNHDLGKEELSKIGDEGITGNAAMAQVVPGSAAVRIEGNFNPKSTDAFSESMDKTTGDVHTTIKINVEKISD